MQRWTVFAAVILIAAHASAQSTDHDKAVASFEEARKLIDEGNCEGALPKLEESMRYEVSVGARLSLADCYEPRDPLEAWKQLREAERLAYLKHDERVKVAQDRATQLEPKLAVVRVVVTPADQQEPGFELRVDGKIVDPYLYAEGVLAMSAGSHTVDASTSERTYTETVSVAVGAPVTVTVRLAPKPPAVVAPPIAPPVPATDAGATQRTIGFAIGGVGVVGLIVGSVFGGLALAKRNEIATACGGNTSACTAPPGSVDSQVSTQQTFTHLSTIGLITGGVALGVGLVLVATAPRGANAVKVGIGPTSIVFTGSF